MVAVPRHSKPKQNRRLRWELARLAVQISRQCLLDPAAASGGERPDREAARGGGRGATGGTADRAQSASDRSGRPASAEVAAGTAARTAAIWPTAMQELEDKYGSPATELRRSLELVNRSDREAESGAPGADRGQSAAGGEHRQALQQSRAAVSRSDSGRQHRTDEGGGEVRVPPRLQVFDLRDLVGEAGHHARHRGPGADHPHSGAHDRDHQQADPHFAAVWCRNWGASPPAKSWPRGWSCRYRRSAA